MSKSSCAASCSTCCRPVSSASATSASSPTATVLHSCRSASNCWAAQRRQLLQRLHRPPTRFTPSGTVRSAAAPSASSNGSPPPNSCYAHHPNQTGALHEPLFPSSASARAPARTQIPCLNWQKLLCRRSFQPPPDTSVRRFQTQFTHQSGRSYPLQRVHALTRHAHPHSKYIAFPVGGFLQVAVSEAPLPKRIRTRTVGCGRSRYSTKTYED
jgi:hypothetical protein